MHRIMKVSISIVSILISIAATQQVASAEVGRLEIGFSPQAFVATSGSLSPLLDPGRDAELSGAIRVSWEVHRLVDVFVGYRRSMPHGNDATTVAPFWQVEMHGALVGARVRYPLVGRWLYVYGLLDLEANALDVTLDLGGDRRGEQTAWSFGVAPEAGVELMWEMFPGFGAILRVGGGYALRLDHDLDAVPIAVEGADARPVDLGSANTSGWLFGATVAFRF